VLEASVAVGVVKKMATAIPHWNQEERYESLSELYLTLWKQLDLYLGGNRWIDVRPPDELSLKERADQVLAEVKRSFEDSPLWAVIEKDYVSVQASVSGVASYNKPEIESLKEYLRDQGIRYAQAIES
jgi:hypothetical protein